MTLGKSFTHIRLVTKQYHLVLIKVNDVLWLADNLASHSLYNQTACCMAYD